MGLVLRRAEALKGIGSVAWLDSILVLGNYRISRVMEFLTSIVFSSANQSSTREESTLRFAISC